MSKPKKFVVALQRFDAVEADTIEEKDGRRGANEAKTRHLPLLFFEAGDKIYVLSPKQHYRKQKEERRQRKQQQKEEKKEKEENDKEEIKVKETHSHQPRAEENDGWLYGEFQGEKGFFPRFYSTPVEEERPEFMYPKPTPPLRATARSSSSRSISLRQENQIDTTETNASRCSSLLAIDTDDEEVLMRRPLCNKHKGPQRNKCPGAHLAIVVTIVPIQRAPECVTILITLEQFHQLLQATFDVLLRWHLREIDQLMKATTIKRIKEKERKRKRMMKKRGWWKKPWRKYERGCCRTSRSLTASPSISESEEKVPLTAFIAIL